VKSLASFEELKMCKQKTVYVRALPHIASVSELFVEPVTSDDWDMLQMDAISLEQGRFLQQISVVFMDQRLDLWLTSGANVSVIVLPKNFEIVGDTAWPKDKVECFAPQDCLCLRVLADTRIIVKPKLRNVELKDYPLRVVPTRQDFLLTDPSMLKLAECLKVNLVNVAERVMLVHPNTLQRLKGCDTMDVKSGEFIALVKASMTAPIAHYEDSNACKPFAVSVALSVDVPEDCVGKDEFCDFVFDIFHAS
jgi:Peroxisome biogenesis factor 1, N-terminal